MRIKRLFPLLLAASVACGVPLEDSVPQVFVAPLQGEWTLETNPNTTLTFTIPGGQPLYTGNFDFTAQLVEAGGATTDYAGRATEDILSLSELPGPSVNLTGNFDTNQRIVLMDGRAFVRSFLPDFSDGIWEDVNNPGRLYVVTGLAGPVVGNRGTAVGCGVAPVGVEEEFDGLLEIEFTGDDIDAFRIIEPSTRAIAFRAPGVFFGASAMRIQRIGGFLFLQRVNRPGTCP